MVSKNEINLEELKKSLKEETKFDIELKLNNNQTYYNAVEDAYFYCLDVKDANSYKDLNLKIYAKEKYKYIIDDEKYSTEKGFFIDFTKPVDVIIYNDKEYWQTQIKFSNLPIVNIISAYEVPPYYQETDFQIYSPNYKDKEKMQLIETKAQMKIRGGTSWMFPKKQYKMTLTYGDKKNNLSFLGMKADEDYILDAMWNDYSKIRTKLSFDIWNQINSYNVSYDEIDIHMEYVEAYMNQQYHGLYMLKEFVDWKKLGVKKFNETNTGIVLKGDEYADWNQETYEKDKKSFFVLGFTMKYPKDQADYSQYWDFMMDKIYTEFYDRENITEEYILKNFDLENYIDYKIFVHAICGNDNYGIKNVYCHVNDMDEDSKVILTPWDLDITYGYEWNGEWPTLLYEEESSITKVDGLLINSEYINNALKKRYFDLRKNILSIDNIFEIIDSLHESITYVIDKDSQKWLQTDLDLEINKIKEWYKRRVEFLDSYLGGENV